MWVVAGRVEGHAERAFEILGVDLDRARGAHGSVGPEHLEVAFVRLCHEDVAVRRHPDRPRTGESFGPERRRETVGNVDVGILRQGRVLGAVAGRGRRIRRREIARSDEPDDARRVGVPVTERGGPGWRGKVLGRVGRYC